MTTDDVILWSDSMVVLYWLKSQGKEYKQFVRERRNEILRLTDADMWRHCPTYDNPADIGDWSYRGSGSPALPSGSGRPCRQATTAGSDR